MIKEKVMIRQKCPTCGNYAEVSHGDDGTGCFVPSDKDKVITELDRQLKSTQLQRQDYCDALNQIKQKLAEQVAYFEEFKSCLRWGKTYPANPSLELLNNLKAESIRENLPDKIQMEGNQTNQYKLGWNDFHREMRLIAGQLELSKET